MVHTSDCNMGNSGHDHSRVCVCVCIGVVCTVRLTEKYIFCVNKSWTSGGYIMWVGLGWIGLGQVIIC